MLGRGPIVMINGMAVLAMMTLQILLSCLTGYYWLCTWLRVFLALKGQRNLSRVLQTGSGQLLDAKKASLSQKGTKKAEALQLMHYGLLVGTRCLLMHAFYLS